jgi:TonB family protein
MKWEDGTRAPAWTFEYAVIQKGQSPGTAPNTPGRRGELQLPTGNEQGLILPFPTAKDQPVLPADLVRKYLRERIMVYGVLNADGKIEQLSVKQSPDPKLNDAVLTAIRKWTFRPAEMNGEKVAVKVLLGFPLSLPESVNEEN